MLSLVNSE